MTAGDSVDATLRVCEILDSLGLAYAVGGSIASSSYGEYRATNDGDIIAHSGLRKSYSS